MRDVLWDAVHLALSTLGRCGMTCLIIESEGTNTKDILLSRSTKGLGPDGTGEPIPAPSGRALRYQLRDGHKTLHRDDGPVWAPWR